MLSTAATVNATASSALVDRPERGRPPSRRSRRAARAGSAATRAAARSAHRTRPRPRRPAAPRRTRAASAAGPSSVAKPHQTKTAERAQLEHEPERRIRRLHRPHDRTRVARLGRMSLYDTFRELPLHIEEVMTEVHVYQVAPEFTRKTTVVHLRPEPYFRHIGPEGLGEDVTYDAERARAAPLAVARPARRLDARVVLGAPRRGRPLPGRRAAAARLPRLPPLGVRVGRARPGAEAGAALDRRGARPRVPRRHVRLLDARDRARRLARALPRPALQARPDARVDGRGDRRRSRAAATSTSST